MPSAISHQPSAISHPLLTYHFEVPTMNASVAHR
jgi:hypothetical protein